MTRRIAARGRQSEKSEPNQPGAGEPDPRGVSRSRKPPPGGGPEGVRQGGNAPGICPRAPASGAPSLDPSGVTRSDELRSEGEGLSHQGRENTEDCRRTAWLSRVAKTTENTRTLRALHFLQAGRRFSAGKRRDWRRAGEERELPKDVSTGQLAREGDRILKGGVPSVWRWHAQRASGQLEHFDRIAHCGELWEVRQSCQGEDCMRARRKGLPETGVVHIPVGCSSRFFCQGCRKVIAACFRQEFNAARAGLVWQADLQGLTARYRKKRGPRARFGERLVTLTTPELGAPDERVRWQFAAIPIFMRAWNEYMREELGGAVCEGTREHAPLVGEDGEPVPLFELCREVRFFEWTDGADRQGHPHFHLWAFGPYVPQRLIRKWWTDAWLRASRLNVDRMLAGLRVLHGETWGRDQRFERVARGLRVLHGERSPGCLVDVRAVKGGSVEVRDADGNVVLDADGSPKRARLDHELIKYLLKDWSAAGFIEPKVFALVYRELVGKRLRQPAAGFSDWAVPILRTCPDCGIVHERADRNGPFRFLLQPRPGSSLEALLDPSPVSRGPPPPLIVSEDEMVRHRARVREQSAAPKRWNFHSLCAEIKKRIALVNTS